MTKREIEKVIKRDMRRVERLKEKIVDIEYDIKATENTIRFWKSELEKAKE